MGSHYISRQGRHRLRRRKVGNLRLARHVALGFAPRMPRCNNRAEGTVVRNLGLFFAFPQLTKARASEIAQSIRAPCVIFVRRVGSMNTRRLAATCPVTIASAVGAKTVFGSSLYQTLPTPEPQQAARRAWRSSLAAADPGSAAGRRCYCWRIAMNLSSQARKPSTMAGSKWLPELSTMIDRATSWQ